MADEFTRQFELKCSPEHAFRTFVEKVDLWWPRGHRKFDASTLTFDARPGGKLTERAVSGEIWTIGEITSYAPPKCLELNWFPGSPIAPTQVTITFAASDVGAEIQITHRAVSPDAAAIWPEKVALFEKGWSALLPSFADTCAQTETEEGAR